MKTIKLGTFEILAKGQRGIGDKTTFMSNEIPKYLETLGNGWRLPTWNEWHYITDLFSFGVLKKSITPDIPYVFFWVLWEGGGKDIDFSYDLRLGWDIDNYFGRGQELIAMDPYATQYESPWIDLQQFGEDEKTYFVLPVRDI